MIENDIIIAPATAGIGAISIIRLSGNGCISLTDTFFSKDLTIADTHTIHFGKLIGKNKVTIDEVLVSVFRNPSSYTKEDVIEISCHGSSYIVQLILNLFTAHGARLAQKGEFTLRAFLNGQLDLSQAEAVADLIASDNKYSHEMALKQMRGGFSQEIKGLRNKLIEFASLIELELDFGEEDVEFANRTDLITTVSDLEGIIKKLIDSFQIGNVIKNGIPTVIAGKPNAGKSTLLNALVNDERAIVSSIPGTTRDTIEEILVIKGLKFKLTDTAGIRESDDVIEKLGVEKTFLELSRARIILYVIDVTTTAPESAWEQIKDFKDHTVFLLLNKMDLYPSCQPNLYYKADVLSEKNVISLSALNKMNITYLKNALFETVIKQDLSDENIISNSRHYESLLNTQESLIQVKSNLANNITGDFVAMDIRHALHHLGLITGEIHTDDLLDSIFSNFCIGK